MRERMRVPTRWLAGVLVVHAVVLVTMTIVATYVDNLKGQVLVLNISVASQLVASVACAAWLFLARRAVAVRVHSQVVQRSTHG